MSGQMYASYLCSTQIGSRIEIDGSEIDLDSPVLKVVIHGHSGHRMTDGIKVVLRFTSTGAQKPFVLNPGDIVTVEDPD